MTEDERRTLANGWMEALSRAEVVTALEDVYARASDAIAQRGPACWASGRCCNFDKSEHRLYVTGIEAGYCLVRVIRTEWANAAQAAREGWAQLTVRGEGQPMPTGKGVIADLDAAIARGGCPFQVRNLCGVHEIKPLGCRVYFCDRSAQEWQHELSERLLGEIRAMHDRFGIEYRYGEWRGMLGMFRA